MTKQITAAERKTVFSQGLKPTILPRTTSPVRQLGASTQPSIATPTEKKSEEATPSAQVRVRAPLKCQFELLSVIIKELLPVIHTHFAAVSLNGDPFDPDWDTLFELERKQALLIWTARTEQGAIVGYAVCSSSCGLFSKSVARCCIESIWLDPAWREGLRGIRFIKSMVEAIRALGLIKKARIYSNDAYSLPVHKAFEYAGFKKVGSMFDMEL